MGNKKKYFNQDKFFYGYKCEALFQQTFPDAHKTSGGADFIYNDHLVEIGRSRILEKQIIVYYRKFFYNIQKEHQKFLKELSPDMAVSTAIYGPEEVWIVPPEKCLFVYFTNSMKYFTLFDYQMILDSELKKKRDGEYYFDVKGNGLIKVAKLYETIADRIGLPKKRPKNVPSDFGVFLDDNV